METVEQQQPLPVLEVTKQESEKLVDESQLPKELEHTCFHCNAKNKENPVKSCYVVSEWKKANNNSCYMALGKCATCGKGISKLVNVLKLKQEAEQPKPVEVPIVSDNNNVAQ